jgi:hypothetical protein
MIFRRSYKLRRSQGNSLGMPFSFLYTSFSERSLHYALISYFQILCKFEKMITKLIHDS